MKPVRCNSNSPGVLVWMYIACLPHRLRGGIKGGECVGTTGRSKMPPPSPPRKREGNLRVRANTWGVAIILLALTCDTAVASDMSGCLSYKKKPEGVRVLERKLLQAARKKDVKTLKELVAKDVKCSFGECVDREAFLEQWELNTSPKKSEIWKVIPSLVNQGAAMEDGVITYPCTAVIPRGDWTYGVPDATPAMVMDGAYLHVEPKDKAKILKVLRRHETVNLHIAQNFGESRKWLKVSTRDGKTGFVPAKYIDDGFGTRTGVAKSGKKDWKITYFISGD